MLLRDDGAGGYRVDHIYQTDPDRPTSFLRCSCRGSVWSMAT